jgi:uncharacterized cupin superfamily protein
MKASLLKDALHIPLGEPAPVALPLGEPVSHTRLHCIERTDQTEIGVWDCTPGRWRRTITEQEFCHFIAGRGSFTPDGGEPIFFQAGDAILLPENSLGIWEVEETIRKTYVIITRTA